ncbi:MAG: HD domain-containing protein [Candidatus Izemoplasmatales bacterium]|nr:HD domain-containing protein [Candidatus Izemoplasmatales bacterium]
MTLEVGQKLDFFGKIDQINSSSYDTYACNVTSMEGDVLVVRINESEEVSLNKIYFFKTEAINFKEKIHLLASEVTIIGEMDLEDDLKEKLMRSFYNYAPLSLSSIRQGVEEKLNTISNPIIKAITDTIYDKYQQDFYLYPAATKFHHAYISGLSYHTLSMMKLAEGFLKVYPFLNEDLIYAGIFLHDICKIFEFDTYEGSEYTLQGRLVGHITMGANLIHSTAKELSFEDAEETLLLEHIIISHHYYGNFGSPKKPNIAEALIIHFIDNIDSKVCVLGEELELIKSGDQTGPIGVLERERYYKHKLSK